MKNDVYEKKMQSLHREYQKLLPLRMREIEKVWGDATAEEESRDDLKLFCRLVHTLAGSGSTFGFKSLSKAAREVEALVSEALESGDPLGPEKCDEIGALLDRMRRSLSRQKKVKPPVVEDAPAGSVHPAMGQAVYWLGEDSEAMAHAKRQLYLFGFDIYPFEHLDGLKGRLQRQKPDVMVVDGYQKDGGFLGEKKLTAWIEALKNDLPLIGLCPRGDRFSHWLAAIRAGATHCMAKPISIMDMLTRLDQLTFVGKTEAFRLLIVDDDEHLALHISTILSKAGMVVEVISDPTRAVIKIDAFQPDLILMDLYMPRCSGLELAQIIRQDQRFLNIPIVFLSRETEINKQLEALKSGAEDFLFKPVKYRYLYHALSSRIQRARELRSRFTHDALTGCYNTKTMMERIEEKLETARDSHGPMVLAQIGVDRLKEINDEHGHPTGDRVLKALAILMKRRLGAKAVFGRFGGGEFAVILPETRNRQAHKLLQHIGDHFFEFAIESGEQSFHVSFSCGVAEFPEQASVRDLLHASAQALEVARQAGGGKVVAYAESGMSVGEGPVDGDSDSAASVSLDRDFNSDEPPIFILDDDEEIPELNEDAEDGAKPEEEDAGDSLGSVVVVDDDEMVLRHTAMTLERWGYRVFQAANGDEGFELTRQHRPDVVLTDLLLFPGIHGFELCDRIKKDPNLGLVKIILMTAVYKDFRYRMEGKDAGSDDFIEKPLDYEDLRKKIEKLIPGR